MHKIALISDTHLSPVQGFFHANVACTIAAVNDAGPDLVVNCGDLTINGADAVDDLRFAAFVHEAVRAPLAIIPGNHDVGEETGALHVDQPVDAARLARYRAVFGADRWARDLGPWRLIGLNGLLVGSGLAEEAEQEDWLAYELMLARDRPIGVFTHKPLWLDGPDGAPRPEWTMAPAQRPAYARRFADAGVRFVASGHLHQRRAQVFDGVLHVWTPSCAFPAGETLAGGDVTLGYATLTLDDAGSVAAAFASPDGLTPHDYVALKGDAPFLKDCPPSPPDVAWP
ncbi:MAG: metallophosphoesterase [Hyphomonadaceae bacterium]|nr:metallophosphoesterase [Hyphomonadaceae bacterium]